LESRNHFFFFETAFGKSETHLHEDRPQRGKSGIKDLNRIAAEFESVFSTHCRDVDQGRVTGEERRGTSVFQFLSRRRRFLRQSEIHI
jgi:hypothetical protein